MYLNGVKSEGSGFESLRGEVRQRADERVAGGIG
jgi:hypothetical protein